VLEELLGTFDEVTKGDEGGNIWLADAYCTYVIGTMPEDAGWT